jgi:8-oxo-dGTP diphosphatase
MKRSVAGIAVENGLVFIAHRLSGGSMGNRWEFPGGKVEVDESDANALMREYQEEFGLDIEVGPFLAQAVFDHGTERFSLHAYRVIMNGPPRVLTEHSEWRWALFSELETLDFADSDRKLFSDLLKTFCI